MTEAFPLQWPDGWSRTPVGKHQDSKYRFKRTGRYLASQSQFWTFADARDALLDEVKALGGRSPVLSTNFPTDRYGMPTERGRRPDDNGVAVYFQIEGKATVMACDMHLRAEENMRSLALSIEAMRDARPSWRRRHATSGFRGLRPAGGAGREALVRHPRCRARRVGGRD